VKTISGETKTSS